MPGGSVALPSYLSVFVEELARQAGDIVFYGHSGPKRSIEDRLVGRPLVRGVDLGPRRSFPARIFRPQPSLRSFRPESDGLDVMLIRGPTPLLPHLVRRASCPVVLLLVGDYRGIGGGLSGLRGLAIRGCVAFYQRRQAAVGRRALVLVNSRSLLEGAPRGWPRVEEVFTSSLVSADLAMAVSHFRGPWGDGKGSHDPLNLLFSGRITEEKGVFEAVEAVASLRQAGINCRLELVGWYDDPVFPSRLRDHARRLGALEHIVDTGYCPAGPQLMARYQAADVLVVPSRAKRVAGRMVTFEGFPRAALEAMATGLPVVASNVGGLADRLSEKTAVLVEPNASQALAAGIRRLLEEPEHRRRVSEAGRLWSEAFTNEQSCALVLEHLRAWTRPNAPSEPD
jgi:glycosyltransferase involved in cell wall biosynthesis